MTHPADIAAQVIRRSDQKVVGAGVIGERVLDALAEAGWRVVKLETADQYDATRDPYVILEEA